MDIVHRPIKEPLGIFFVHRDPPENELRQCRVEKRSVALLQYSGH